MCSRPSQSVFEISATQFWYVGDFWTSGKFGIMHTLVDKKQK